MTVELDAASAELIQQEVERGIFSNADEAVACAVRLLVERDGEDWLLQNRAGVRSALEESLAAEASGQMYSREEAEAMLAEHRKQRRSKAA